MTQFLEEDLLPQVKQAFAHYKPADKAAIQKQLDKAIEQAESLGADPDALPKVRELRRQVADEAVDLDALEAQVFDHLYGFLRRYYAALELYQGGHGGAERRIPARGPGQLHFNYP